MIFHETPLPGAYTIELKKIGDDRGFFARFYCPREMGEMGLMTEVRSINNSLSAEKGTLRGMHYQLPPHAETKIVRCIRGALWDCIVDLRPKSPTFGQWFGAELTAENRLMMYCPKGFGHGFLALTEDSEALYLTDAFYAPEAERGVRWNDPKFAIEWPAQPAVLSDKDRDQRDFDPDWHLTGMDEVAIP